MSLSDEAKGALWKLRSKSYKPGYLYYPAGKVWLPAQCDLEGRLVIDPSDLDTRYLKLDGSNTADKVVFNYDGMPKIMLKTLSANILMLRLSDDSDYAALLLKGLSLTTAGILNCLTAHMMIPNTGLDADNCTYFNPATRKLWIYNADELGWNFITLGA